ncbi:MAG: nucleotidyltransferase domain-containing protein [Oscillospiraceae bacterium]|nr:nucleotidyltransferase domain-containing protein [Oscillospiraceae bacterium]
MDIVDTAHEICAYFSLLPDVKKCTIYGSIAENYHDEFSDIDIELDVSGRDNSLFSLQIPELLNNAFPVLFFDYAPSLMPGGYIVSNAISSENPFLMVDIKCVAVPHFASVTKSDFPFSRVDHTLKVFVANLKHMLRGADCYDDIFRMHSRVCQSSDSMREEDMMKSVFRWLEANADSCLKNYLESLRSYL